MKTFYKTLVTIFILLAAITNLHNQGNDILLADFPSIYTTPVVRLGLIKQMKGVIFQESVLQASFMGLGAVGIIAIGTHVVETFKSDEKQYKTSLINDIKNKTKDDLLKQIVPGTGENFTDIYREILNEKGVGEANQWLNSFSEGLIIEKDLKN